MLRLWCSCWLCDLFSDTTDPWPYVSSAIISQALIPTLPLLNEAEKGSMWIKNSTALIVDKYYLLTSRFSQTWESWKLASSKQDGVNPVVMSQTKRRACKDGFSRQNYI